MDTDSLLFSFKLNLYPERVIDRLKDRFDLVLPYKVFEEYNNKVKKGMLKEYDIIKSDIDIFFKQMMKDGKIYDYKKYSYCLKYIKRWFNLMGLQKQFHKIDDGEKHCIALGLFLSRYNKKCLFVITDDFEAIKAGIETFVKKQKIGLVYSIPDIMIWTYLVDKRVSRSHIRGFINDYFNLNVLKSKYFYQLKDELVKEIEWSCRVQLFDECKLCCI